MRNYIKDVIKRIIKKYPLYIMEQRVAKLEFEVARLTNICDRLCKLNGDILQYIDQ